MKTMKSIALFLVFTVSPFCFAARGVPTTCKVDSTLGHVVSLSDTINTAPTWAPAGYRSHFEWFGPLKWRVQYVDAMDNTKSVVTIDTTGMIPGTYKAVGKLMLMDKDQVIGWGKCETSVTVQ